MSEPITATNTWDVLHCRKKTMGLDYFTKYGFDSLDDQSHVLKEEKSESVKKASKNADKVGKDDSKTEERSLTTKSVTLQRRKQVQSGINDKVVSDLSNRKYVISESSKREGKIDVINFVRQSQS